MAHSAPSWSRWKHQRTEIFGWFAGRHHIANVYVSIGSGQGSNGGHWQIHRLQVCSGNREPNPSIEKFISFFLSSIRCRSLQHVFVKIWIDEGPRTLLRGYWATILGVIPYAGTSFFTFETLKRKHYRKYPSAHSRWLFALNCISNLDAELTGEKKPHALLSLGYGAIAGVIGQTASYPLDIVRRRMQTVGMMKHLPDNYDTIYSSLKTIYK